jgi:hypothetical protein
MAWDIAAAGPPGGAGAALRALPLSMRRDEHRHRGAQQDLHVAPEGRAGDIGDVERHALGVAGVAAAADLPRAGQARTDREVVLRRGAVVGGELPGLHRPRADQAHLALQHVDQLRQLVERGSAQEAADPGHARVVAQLAGRLPLGPGAGIAVEQLSQPAVGVGHHGAKLQAAEEAAAAADPLMRVEHTAAIHADQCGQHSEDGRREQQQGTRAHDIERTLGRRPQRVGQAPAGIAEIGADGQQRSGDRGLLRLVLARERLDGFQARHGGPRERGLPASLLGRAASRLSPRPAGASGAPRGRFDARTRP